MKIVIQDIFLKQMQSIRRRYLIPIKIYHFYQKEKKLEELKNLFVVQKTKKNMLSISLKQALNHGLKFFKKAHRVIQFNKKAWLKPYIDKNTELRKEQKMNLEIISLS